MTPLPHNPAITVIDLPEGAKQVRLNPVHSLVQWKEKGFEHKPYWDGKLLPPGNYKLICLGLQATEEEAREIVQYSGHRDRTVYNDYELPFDCYILDTATASLRSLITSNGW